MDGIGRGFWKAVSWFKAWLGIAPQCHRRAGAQARARRGGPAGQGKEKSHAARGARHRAARTGRRKERARPGRAAGDAVRFAQERRAAAHESARRSARAGCCVFARFARGHVAPGGNQAAGLRRRGRSGRRASGAGGHALRDAAGTRREGQPDLRPRQGPGARAVGHFGARGRSDPGQVGDGPGDPEREARDGHAGRDHQVALLRRGEFAADAGAGQGHRRQPDRGGSGEDAASAHRRHHGLGQVGGHQRHGAVAALQGHRRACAADHDRSEDARAVGVRGHPASAGARGHRHEAGGQRAALVGGRDGAPLPADGGAGRAQHRRLQQEGARGQRSRQADQGPGDDAVRVDRSDLRPEADSRSGCRCRTSS